jgi:vacuole membrane protein 1
MTTISASCDYLKNKDQLVLSRHPVVVIRLFFNYMKRLIYEYSPHPYILLSGAMVLVLLNTVPQLLALRDFLLIGLYWLILGIVSSIGFGTGVPTGVLLVFPRIIVTAVNNGPDKILLTFRELYYPVGMWALGTALGELPPYYVARTVRLNSIKNKEQMTTMNDQFESGIMNNMQRYMETIIKKWNFWGILFFASYPNALFDLCGMVSGHYLVPCSVFLSATIIGKVLIKANLQLHLLVLATFADRYLGFIPKDYRVKIAEFADRARIPGSYNAESSSVHFYVSGVWQLVVLVFMGYFVINFIHAMAQLQYEYECKHQQHPHVKNETS